MHMVKTITVLLESGSLSRQPLPPHQDAKEKKKAWREIKHQVLLRKGQVAFMFFSPCGHWLGRPGCHTLSGTIKGNLTSLGPFFFECKLPRPDRDENTYRPQRMQPSNLYVYQTPLLPRWYNYKKKKRKRWQLKSPAVNSDGELSHVESTHSCWALSRASRGWKSQKCIS